MEIAGALCKVFGNIGALTFKWTNDGNSIASMCFGDFGTRQESSKPNEYRGYLRT
jgi:hypothetical protein